MNGKPYKRGSQFGAFLAMGFAMGLGNEMLGIMREPTNPVNPPEPTPEDIERRTRHDDERIAAAQAKRERKAARRSTP